MSRLTAALVIPTYQRPAELQSALVYWERSMRQPDQVIVVDSSPDAAAARTAVLAGHPALFSRHGSIYLCATRPSITSQRNLALEHVRCDVVVFADDDTLPAADFLDKIMQVYEEDRQGVVGGVGGTNQRAASGRARLRRRALDVFRHIARRLEVPHGSEWVSDVALPRPVAGLPVVRRRSLHGADMSFRTELATRLRLDENLDRYAYGEDFDLSYRVSRTHALVVRRDALVCHEPAPGGRPGATQRFLISWVNPAYLVEKLFPVPAARRPLLRLFGLYRLRAQLTAPFTGSSGRAQLELYEIAGQLMSFLRDGPATSLSERFRDAQEWIYEDGQQPNRASVEAWLRRHT